MPRDPPAGRGTAAEDQCAPPKWTNRPCLPQHLQRPFCFSVRTQRARSTRCQAQGSHFMPSRLPVQPGASPSGGRDPTTVLCLVWLGEGALFGILPGAWLPGTQGKASPEAEGRTAKNLDKVSTAMGGTGELTPVQVNREANWEVLFLQEGLLYRARLCSMECSGEVSWPPPSFLRSSPHTLPPPTFGGQLVTVSDWQSVLLTCLVALLCPTLCNPMDCSPQAPLSMGILQQEYWSALPLLRDPTTGDVPNPGIEPKSPTLQADSSPSEPPEKLTKREN